MTHRNSRQDTKELKPIADIAATIGLSEDDIEAYGR
jgi:formyltetrahydrofolate synthetase